jgi:glycosyltransferase involved in cell wall biosynthesis
MLLDEVGLAPERVLLHHEFIDAVAVAERTVSLRQREQLRRQRGIPADTSIVMGAGTIDWRKGPDLFIQLATEVRRRIREPVHFVWVGGDLRGTDWERLRSDLLRTGADHVHFVGTHPDPLPWFATADVFVLTSREDPYPLVCLEHAVMGHPIITYRNGGMVELLEEAGPQASMGIVDHMDVGTMADRVLAFLENDRLREEAGAGLREQALTRHDVRVAAPKLFADLQALVDDRAAAAVEPSGVS